MKSKINLNTNIMSTWFECKVRYDKIENGQQKRVSEPYLVDAVSFTDAEKRINEVLQPYISGEFLVQSVKIAPYADLLPNENGDRWFRSKVAFISYDENTGRERRSNANWLVQSNNIKEAYDEIEKSLQGIVSDTAIIAIQESPIMDVFPYQADEEKQNEENNSDDNA